MNIGDLQKQVAGCRECSLRKRCNQVSVPTGKESARIMVVAPSPNMEDGIEGVAWVGQPSEFMLNHLTNIFPRNELYLTTLVKCFPGRSKKGDNLPPLYAINRCRPYLESEIGFVDPEVIVTVGALAMQKFGIKGGVKKNSGKVFWNEEFQLPVIPVVAPGGLMRKKTRPEDILSFVTSLTAIKTLLDGGMEEPKYSEDLSWAG